MKVALVSLKKKVVGEISLRSDVFGLEARGYYKKSYRLAKSRARSVLIV